MIYVLHGEDDFSKKAFLNALREEIGQIDIRDANTTVLEGPDLKLQHLLQVANVVPFLAERRLVIAAGLLGRFEEVRPATEKGSGRRKTERPFGRVEGVGRVAERAASHHLAGFLGRKTEQGQSVAIQTERLG